MYSFGVGSMVDLPNFSVIIAGLDDWKTDYAGEIAEDRLLAAIRAETGLGLGQVKVLRSAPWLEETRNPFEEWSLTGVPVVPFPRWMRCAACNLLTTVDVGLLQLKQNPFRPDQTRYVHRNCTKAKGKPPTAVPARFVVACSNGHIDDFPWVEFVHRSTGGTCPVGNWRLQARDVGQGARSTDMVVTCLACSAKAGMNAAFGEHAATVLPLCRGRHAHIRQFDKICGQQVRPLLLGASNAWFAATRSVLSIPASEDELEQIVAECWPKLNNPEAPVDSPATLKVLVTVVPELKRLGNFDLDDVWAAIERHRGGDTEEAGETDLLGPEWRAFTVPDAASESRDFRLGNPELVPGFAGIASVTAAERLREVVALCGFTRIDGPDSGVASDLEGAIAYAPMSRKQVDWVPAAEVRGEGIFIRLEEQLLTAWEDAVVGGDHLEGIHEAHQRWRRSRGHTDINAGWPGERYVLVHSLSHLLINELALECGYSAASIRERIYACPSADAVDAMAGVLLYTSAPDSEGTLGGLVALAEPGEFRRILDAALRNALLCSSDPMCAGHMPNRVRAGPSWSGLPRLPVPPRDQLRARQPVPRPQRARRDARRRRHRLPVPVVKPHAAARDVVLLACVREAALTLPVAHTKRLAATVARADTPTSAVRAAAVSAVPTPVFRDVARKVIDAWAAAEGVDGSALALALTAAADSAAQLRSSQAIDVVWTGPASPEVPVRLTSEVLTQVIDSAQSSLIVVSFAAYKVAEIVDALARAAHRHVDVRLVLETGEEHGGPLKVGAAHAFADLGDSVDFYVWPADERPELPNGGLASMHAKAAIIDERIALVGSANLTGFAIASNMELGLLITGGPVPRRLARHFRALMASGVLRPTN